MQCNVPPLIAMGWDSLSLAFSGGPSFALGSRKPINTAVLRVAALDGQLPGKARSSFRALWPNVAVWWSAFVLDLDPGVSGFNSLPDDRQKKKI
jgi:hypothetical protein